MLQPVIVCVCVSYHAANCCLCSLTSFSFLLTSCCCEERWLWYTRDCCRQGCCIAFTRETSCLRASCDRQVKERDHHLDPDTNRPLIRLSGERRRIELLDWRRGIKVPDYRIGSTCCPMLLVVVCRPNASAGALRPSHTRYALQLLLFLNT